MYHILLVEDDIQISKSLMLNLKYSGYSVESAFNISQAKKILNEQKVDLILLDVNLPDGTGIDFCRNLRDIGSDVPVLFLSARTDEETVVEGINVGADDYIRKPFGTEELKVRIKKSLNKTTIKRQILKVGELSIHLDRREIKLDKKVIRLAKREFDILTILAQRPGDIISRENIMTSLNETTDIYDRTIDSHISHLRKKIKDLTDGKVKVESVYGVGYKIEWSES